MSRLSEREKERHVVLIRKGDLVRVMIGRDREEFKKKAKTARVLSVDPVKQTVTVEQAHLIKRRTRPNPQKNVKGGIVEREAPIHISNVRLVCPSCSARTRIGYRFKDDGRKARFCKKCDANID